jgi:dihydroflavonol-4-reductase
VVEADLLNAESLAKAIEAATFVVHTASPFVLRNPKTADELVRPAVDGTMAVVQACHASKVKRLVVTSSCAAVTDCAPEARPDVFTEENWSDPEQQRRNSYYSLSKTLAEKAAWDFVKSLPEKERFELVTINPSLVVGKPLHTHAGFSSGEVITKLFTGAFPVVRMQCPMVRVEDVAVAHLRAIKVPEAAGERFILHNESRWF